MSGVLYVTATPIGHLDDISLRALRIFGEVDVLFCEDTRHTQRLLARHSLSVHCVSFHQYSGDKAILSAAQRLQDGESAALVTDAGTPCISDPGWKLVDMCYEKNISVQVVPGPDAVTAALSIAGIGFGGYTFLGFIPHKKGRQKMFTKIVEEKELFVMYESPHRILKTLASLAELAPEMSMIVVREMTKIHEEVVRGTAQELSDDFSSRDIVKGEFVLIVDNRK